jgi:hypothetical protein
VCCAHLSRAQHTVELNKAEISELVAKITNNGSLVMTGGINSALNVVVENYKVWFFGEKGPGNVQGIALDDCEKVKLKPNWGTDKTDQDSSNWEKIMKAHLGMLKEIRENNNNKEIQHDV